MVTSRPTVTVALAFAAVLWSLTTTAHAAKASDPAGRPPDCSASRDGQLTVGTLSVRSKGRKPFTLEQRSTHNLDTGAITVSAVVRQGRQVALQIETTIAASGSSDGRVVYGHGFKGIRELTFTTDGTTVRGVIDGRPTVAVPVGATSDSLVFEDGQRAPVLRVRATLRKALIKLRRQASVGCPAASPAVAQPVTEVALKDPLPPGPVREKDPEDSTDCIYCQAKCAGAYVGCLSAAAATGPFVIFGGPSCMAAASECLQDGCLAPGEECCPKACGSLCCTNETTCCGDFACCSRGSHCADPKLSICCPEGSEGCRGGCCPAGDKCVENFYCCPANAGDFCGQELGCCPSGQRCFQEKAIDGTIIDQVCCDREPCNGTCCPAGQVCSVSGCCNPSDLCNGACCPRAEGNVCLNGTTCCQAGKVCGGGCCPGLATCCNGTCCPGLGDQCIGGLCCPENRACGPTCCPDGYACTNAAAGTCTPCTAGNEPCRSAPGNPLCCPTGQQCCGNGACCGAGTLCCGSPPGCYDASVCLP